MGNNTTNTTEHTPRVKRTPEERAEHRRQYLKEYMQKYRANNSDKTMAWRVQAAKNLLQREGYSITRMAIDDIVIVKPDRVFVPAKDGDGEV